MRRISALVASSVATRSIASASFTLAEVAKAEGVTEANLKKLNPRTTTWIGLDVVAREKLSAFTATVNNTDNYYALFNDALAKAPKAIPETAKDDLRNSKDLLTFFKAYAAVMGPVHQIKKLLEIEQLEHAYLKDRLKIGLASFKQAQLDEAKKNLVVIEATIAKLEAELATIGKTYFTTDSYNDMVNACRIMASKNSSAQRVAQRLLDDMTLVKVAFNECTKMLLNNVVFGDGPLEDSGMLFAFVEYPERGEVFATKSTDLNSIATQTMKIMGDRHQTPVDGGRKLQQPDTHPCLQRSPE